LVQAATAMRRSIQLSVAPAIWFAALVDADVSYVTDLEIFSLLVRDFTLVMHSREKKK
jgi:hypothetical protein